MKTADEIEAMLLRLDLPYEEKRPGLWVVRGAPGIDNLVVTLAGPVLVFRLKIMDVPKVQREQLFRALLEMNAADLVHAAYGLENDTVVLSGALAAENLDFNELQATVDDITLAFTKHYPRLQKFHAAA